MDFVLKKNKDKIKDIKIVKIIILIGYLILVLMFSIIYVDEISD